MSSFVLAAFLIFMSTANLISILSIHSIRCSIRILNSNRFKEYHCIILSTVFLQYDDDLNPAWWYLNLDKNLQLHMDSQHAPAPEVLPERSSKVPKIKPWISLAIKTYMLYIPRPMSLFSVIVLHLCNTVMQEKTDCMLVQVLYIN